MNHPELQMRNKSYTNPCFHGVHGRISSIPGSIARVTARVDWKDQGWGNISASILLVKVDAKGNTSRHTIFSMKSHRRETLTFDTNTNGLDFFKSFKKGDGLQLWYNVGGSGHKLYVYDLKVTVTYASSSSIAPPNQVTINVGSSTTNNKVITLPKPHMIVSPKAINGQHPSWKDTFDVAVVGNKLYVSRSDTNLGWGQNLQFGAVPDPIWNKTVNVGSSSSNSKRIRLPEINMDVSPYPVNRQDPNWNDVFKVDVNGYYATVTRLDSNGGWGQNLTLYCRKLSNWGSDVDIVYGPDDDHIYTPGERVRFTMTALPQNHFTGAITQLYAYIGLKGSRNKQFFELYNGVPGASPKAVTKDIEYVVPSFPNNLAKHDGYVLEVGYGTDLQYSMANAKRNWDNRGQTGNALDYLPVNVPSSRKDSFKCDLLQKFPTHAIADEPLTLDVSYRPQDHYPGAISQMFVYFKDENGGVDVCKLTNTVPGSNPPTQRGGVSYLVPDMAAGKKVEVGVYFDLQYKFEDAVNNFKRNGKNGSKVFGSFTTMSSTDPKAEDTRKKNKTGMQTNNKNHPKLQRAIENKISSEWYDTLKKAGEKAATKLMKKFIKYGARKLVAATADDATLLIMKTVGKKAGERAAVLAAKTFSQKFTTGFAVGIGAIKLGKAANPIMFASMVGEFAGEWMGGKIGKHFGGDTGEVIGSNIGGLAGAVALGAVVGSVVPGAGTLVGAAVGAVSWGIGKAASSIFSLF